MTHYPYRCGACGGRGLVGLLTMAGMTRHWRWHQQPQRAPFEVADP